MEKTGLYVIYKCKKCGNVFEIKQEYSPSLIFGIDNLDKEAEMYLFNVSNPTEYKHSCDKNSLGISELIGCRFYE
jgi:hypothetical protein